MNDIFPSLGCIDVSVLMLHELCTKISEDAYKILHALQHVCSMERFNRKI